MKQYNALAKTLFVKVPIVRAVMLPVATTSKKTATYILDQIKEGYNATDPVFKLDWRKLIISVFCVETWEVLLIEKASYAEALAELTDFIESQP